MPRKMKALVKKADGGCAKSALDLFHMIRDFDESRVWLQKAAALVDAWAQFREGQFIQSFATQDKGLSFLEREKEYQDAIVLLRKSADQGHGQAYNILAHAYYRGYGVEQDKEKSHEYDLEGSKRGYYFSSHSVANNYLQGAIGKDKGDKGRDVIVAERFYRLAIQQGGAEAREAKDALRKDVVGPRREILGLLEEQCGFRMKPDAKKRFVSGPLPGPDAGRQFDPDCRMYREFFRAHSQFSHIALCFLHGSCGFDVNWRLAREMFKASISNTCPCCVDDRDRPAERLLRALRSCAWCGKEDAMKTCTLCHGPRYCGRRCQQYAWNRRPHRLADQSSPQSTFHCWAAWVFYNRKNPAASLWPHKTWCPKTTTPVPARDVFEGFVKHGPDDDDDDDDDDDEW